MEIGGLQKLTLIDYPGKIAVTVFTVGCNFRCPFCYSTEIVLPEKLKNHPRISQAAFFSFLEKKNGLIEGVVICGGEPTCQKDLPLFSSKIKKMGFDVKLDTNGSNPKMLKKLIDEGLINYVAMDIKSPKEKYPFFSGRKDNVLDVEKSINILKQEKIEYEFRTTVAPGLASTDIFQIAEWIGPARAYFLQAINLEKDVVNPEIKKLPLLSKEEIQRVISKIKNKFKICKFR